MSTNIDINAKLKRKFQVNVSYDIYETACNLVDDLKVLTRPKIHRKYLALKQDFPEIFERFVRNDDFVPNYDQELKLLKKIIEVRENLASGRMSEYEAVNTTFDNIKQHIPTKPRQDE